MKTVKISVALLLVALLPTPAAAMPVVPDNLPVYPPSQVTASPKITVTDEAGNPVVAPVHRGDVLLVHGSGFDPNANRGGFLIPIPPGTPNGVFVLYSALPDHWKPSEGAPEAARKHPHDRMAWVMPAGTLEAIPNMPLDFRRSIARVAQPMNDDGTFTARVIVDPPAQTPGSNWGIYVYAGAGSINAAEEIFVPIAYSAEPGANTPKPATADIIFDATAIAQLGGGINATNGAARDGNSISFSKEAEASDGTIRYRGTTTASARYNAVEVSFANPWLEPRGDGVWALTAEVSDAPHVGVDAMTRREIGTVTGTTGEQVVRSGGVEVTKIFLR